MRPTIAKVGRTQRKHTLRSHTCVGKQRVHFVEVSNFYFILPPRSMIPPPSFPRFVGRKSSFPRFRGNNDSLPTVRGKDDFPRTVGFCTGDVPTSGNSSSLVSLVFGLNRLLYIYTYIFIYLFI